MKIPQLIRQQLKGKKRLKKMSRLLPPKKIERSYEAELVNLLNKMQSLIKAQLIPKLKNWQDQLNYVLPSNVKTDEIPDDISDIIEEIRIALFRDYTPVEIRRIADKVGQDVSQYNKYLMENNLKRVLGFDVFFAQPYLKQELSLFNTMNASLIKDLAESTLNKVEKDVMRGFATGTRWEEIASDLEDYIDPLNGTVRSRARLIARDQVNKLNGQLAELRQSELGVTRYIWRTALDERVRPEHLLNEGKIFEWNDPPNTGHPGSEINCRCYAEPVLSDLLETVQEQDVNTGE